MPVTKADFAGMTYFCSETLQIADCAVRSHKVRRSPAGLGGKTARESRRSQFIYLPKDDFSQSGNPIKKWICDTSICFFVNIVTMPGIWLNVHVAKLTKHFLGRNTY